MSSTTTCWSTTIGQRAHDAPFLPAGVTRPDHQGVDAPRQRHERDAHVLDAAPVAPERPIQGLVAAEHVDPVGARNAAPAGQPRAELHRRRIALPGEAQVGRPRVPLGRAARDPDGWPARAKLLLDALPNRRQPGIEVVAGALGRDAVAVAGDGVQAVAPQRRAVAARPHVVLGAGRVDAVPLGHERQRLDQRVDLGRARLARLEVAEQRDPDRAVVVVERVPGHDAVADDLAPVASVRLATAPALVDPAAAVDQQVVADVAPALGDGVVGVDRADVGLRVAEVAVRGRVVDDQQRGRDEGGRPLVDAVLEAQRLVGAPGLAADDALQEAR